ncbi:MAG: hypothetical protein IJV98_06535 [Clostridia bacterium]|nr:hypothetical protein [Clostridia bacterium]
MDKVCKVARILTLAQLLAAFSLTMLYFFRPEVYPTGWHYAYMLFYLGILPMLAYPLQPIVPKFKHKGREGQRTLAMIFAVVGYLLSALTCALTDATPDMWLVTLEYLISGVLILVFNKVFHLRASAHGCGTAGPIFLLMYFGLYIPSAIMAVLTVVAYVSSVKMKRHTYPQLIGGSLISVLLLAVLIPLFHIFGA